MSSSLQIGDRIIISGGGSKNTFIISKIYPNLIYISPINSIDTNNAIVNINGQWKVKGAESNDYRIEFPSTISQNFLYEWPTTSDEVVHPEEGSDFLKYARQREARIIKLMEKYGNYGTRDLQNVEVKTEYPGYEYFEDIPEKLVRHIAEYDTPIENSDRLEYPILLKQIWLRYGPILKHVDFFLINPSREYMCIMGQKVATLMGILPYWVQKIYQDTLDEFLKSGNLRCGVATVTCLETVKTNRGFRDIQLRDEPLEKGLYILADEIRQGLHTDRGAIVIEFDLGNLADHTLTIIRLIDPTKKQLVYRDFVCQSYVFQTTLMMEEVEDVPRYLERIADLKGMTKWDIFELEYERLFHANLSRLPKEEEWVEGPFGRVINSK